MEIKAPHARSRIVGSMAELIGQTPLVRLTRIVPAGHAEVLVKLESFNPAGSVKDRIAWSMIERAEQDGALKPGYTIVEPTSGNTGIGLALVAAIKGYRLIITMPDDASPERRKLLEHFGAQVVLTPAKKLMNGAIERARDIVASNPSCFMPQQFDNMANPQIHRETTGREIIEATDGRVDAFVAGVGTGGTITGVGEVLKAHDPAIRIVAIEPQRSQALSGGATKPHGIQGIGAGFIPSICNRDVIDEVLACEDEAAYQMARALAREEGISAGISAGANVWGAIQVAQTLGPGKRVITIICDAWDRYISMERTIGPIPGLDFII
ncbi:MAG: cysteine synthase A [Myxococcota bacterium]|nr:cysteine synthase A [Myxococcota bacterium]